MHATTAADDSFAVLKPTIENALLLLTTLYCPIIFVVCFQTGSIILFCFFFSFSCFISAISLDRKSTRLNSSHWE